MPFVKRERTYYKYGTEPNASIVGSFARIDKGVASGFSSTNYLEVTNSFDVSGGKTWEMVYTVTTGSNVSTMQSICGHESTTTNSDPVVIGITSGKFSILDLNTSSSSGFDSVLGSYNVTANTTYFIKMLFNGSEYILSYSLDGVDYVEDVKVTRSTPIWTSNLILGRQESSDSSMFPWLGTIDLSQSYIKINGQTWWSGDSYTKVGSWIDDGVVSGFTASNYLSLPELFNPSSNAWEMVYKIITGDDVITEGVITGEAVSVDYQNVLSIVDARIFFRWSSSHSSYDYTIEGSSTILANTTYWVKLKFDGVSTYTIELSTNGVDFTVDGSRTVTGYTFNSYKWNIGRSGHSTTTYALPFTNGSIDLTQSYIKINNKDWWHGTKAVESTEADADYHVDRNKLYQLAAVKRSYYKYGTEPNASIVGSFARIDKGVASGFSSTNYLEVTNSFDVSGGKTWEMVYTVTTGSNVSTMQSICGHESTTTNSDPVVIGITSGKFSILDLNTSSSSGFDSVLGSYNVTANTTYFIKMLFNGSEYILSYSLDGVDYVEDVKVTRSTPIWTSNLILGRQESSDSSMFPWLGTIDLSQSYIKINGQTWWSGDSYTKVGSWIDDGVVSGFTASNYLSLPELFNPSSNAWEMVYKIITGDDVITEGVITGEAVSVDYQNVLSIVDARIFFRWSSSHSSYDYTIEGSSTILANTTYWVKLKFDGVSTYTIELSTNGVDFTVDGSRTVTGYTFNSYKWNIGRSGHSTTTYALPFTNGSIDLTQSYIKINNKDWWHGTKAVESTEADADYHVDRNKLYQLAAVKRSYYKDGVVIPESSITDFGSTKYFKNVVTTKYWKEITTGSRELGYACYYISNNGLYYYYAKTPIGSDMTVYMNDMGRALGKKVSDPSEFNSTSYIFSSLTESNAKVSGFNATVTRSTADDLYIDTTVTETVEGTPEDYTYTTEEITKVEVGVDDDYDFTEFVPSAEFDYYTDKLLSYAPIVRGVRSYYKQDLNQRDTGTYTFTLDKEYTAKMLFVGNGGGGCSSQKDSRWHYSSGGSGACFEGLVRLLADTYTLTIGTLGYGNNYNNTHFWSGGVQSTDSYLTNSAGEELIRVGAGGMGYTSGGGVGGAAGVLTLGTLDIIETKKATDGVYTAGNTSAGSVSAYDGTYSGYGAGTGSQRGQGDVYGIAGIFDLVLETDISDYDWYEDVGTKVY